MNARLKSLIHFLDDGIWRIREEEVSHLQWKGYTCLKIIYLSINQFINDRIVVRASALTYSTLLSIIPILALLFAIARGFGFDTLIESQFRSGVTGAQAELVISWINSYLEHAQSGIFIGVGLIMLLGTVLLLIDNIERSFNAIWQVKKPRSLFRQITDYSSLILLLPVLLVISSGLSIFMSTYVKELQNFMVLAPVLKFFVRLIPYALIWGMFIGLYTFMPNTKVKLAHAWLPGILAGSAFQAFQYFYINSQIWVSNYNAIYGSFAAIPLFLLWTQISWSICLFGAELTYAGQNIRSLSFDQDTRNISRRYRDFISILIMSLIAKRFERNEPPYTAAEISEEHQIPIRLTNQVLYQLQEIDLIHEVVTDQKSEDIGYQPSMDINQLNVAILLDRLDTYGSENFKIDKDEEFNDEWKVLTESREEYYKKASKVLMKDL